MEKLELISTINDETNKVSMVVFNSMDKNYLVSIIDNGLFTDMLLTKEQAYKLGMFLMGKSV